MTKHMLIDATHAEETRVVVLDGNRLDDFDLETSTKRQLKGNIYLAKVVRVEPSLQAAFVEYGGGRHGFLAFGEIHPDYYQIPVADRQRLLDMQAEEARAEQEEDDRVAAEEPDEDSSVEPIAAPTEAGGADSFEAEPANPGPERVFVSEGTAEAVGDDEIGEPPGDAVQPALIAADVLRGPDESIESADAASIDAPEERSEIEQTSPAEPGGLPPEDPNTWVSAVAPAEETDPIPPHAEAPPELVGGDHDGTDDQRERRSPSRFTRNYKIQEVIKRRQILLVQVVKEERGTKGAALTTYLSLAGRYCVLMPNSPRGGGISRKITSLADRRRLKEATAELDLPKGMGLIVRTAGANRPKPEIKRDCEYLLRLWDDIREHTMHSIAPAQIYEEASLIKRSIRDVYSRDVDELIVDGEDGWRAARDFMRMLMPSHAKKVQLWSEPQPLFARFQVDAQLDAMMTPTVQLRSGGYLVINQTEALVAIDVNSGRSTRERGIEETAVRTNLEAADEAARQLRLRDLAGLVVIDFIDMESKKNNTAVEKRMKDALKLDRARIQLGHISHFGLLEMSRQRLRPSLAETNFIPCPHCAGLGHVRSTESAAIHVLRGIEEEAAKRRAAEVVVHVAPPIAMYILNHKRNRLGDIEQRYGVHVGFEGDESLIAPQFRIDRVRAQVASDVPVAVRPEAGQEVRSAAERMEDEVEADAVEVEEEDAPEAAAAPSRDDASPAVPVAETAEEGEQRRKRRRRRRRGPRSQEAGGTEADGEETGAEPPGESTSAPVAPEVGEMSVEGVPEHIETPVAEDDGAGRRRGRRGRSRHRRSEETLPEISAPGAEQPDLPPVYAGPTPADPFGGQAFDIFDVLERAEAQADAAASPALPSVIEPDPLPEPPADAPASIEPGVAPVLVGAEETPPAARKRGWWRR
ncbi:MAG: Rne/Rng family ribonuclease [Caulobacteraceae bacterium]